MRQKFYRCFPPRHILASAIKTLYDKEEDVEEELSQDSASERSSAGKAVLPKQRPQSESSSLLGGMTPP